MKTKSIITVLILISTIIGCLIVCSNNSKASGLGNNTCVYVDKDQPYVCQVHLIKVRGHEYLVSYTGNAYGGTCIIHAAHCQIKDKENENNNTKSNR